MKSYQIIINTANKLAINYARNCINTMLKPVDYTRTKEVPAIIDVSGILKRKDDNLRILDIGSPQILSLSLSRYSKNWNIVYINPFKSELEDLKQKSSVLGLENLDIRYGDITKLDNIPGIGRFDYIFSCSVFEHIHPEAGGDATASKNVSQLLEEEGTFAFSVPYYKKAFNEYVSGDVYSIHGKEGEKTFFQRFYDEETLLMQIIEPSGLKVTAKKFIGERYFYNNDINKRLALKIDSGKKHLLLGRLFNRISDIFMEESDDHNALKKPYLAIYSLNKTP